MKLPVQGVHKTKHQRGEIPTESCTRATLSSSIPQSSGQSVHTRQLPQAGERKDVSKLESLAIAKAVAEYREGVLLCPSEESAPEGHSVPHLHLQGNTHEDETASGQRTAAQDRVQEHLQR